MSQPTDSPSRKLKYVDPAAFTPHFAWEKSEARSETGEEVVCERVRLDSVAQKFGTPTYLYSRGAIDDGDIVGISWFLRCDSHANSLDCLPQLFRSNQIETGTTRQRSNAATLETPTGQIGWAHQPFIRLRLATVAEGGGETEAQPCILEPEIGLGSALGELIRLATHVHHFKRLTSEPQRCSMSNVHYFNRWTCRSNAYDYQ